MSDRLADIKARLKGISPAPWGFNGYSTLFSVPLGDGEDAVDEEFKAAGRPKEGDAWSAPGGWRDRLYEANSAVCYVPAHHGDSSTGRHWRDGEWIAEAPSDVEWLIGEVERLRAERADAMAGDSDE